MTTATLPSGTGVVSTYTYDNADRLTGISHVKGGTTLASAAYTLDNVGNRTQRVDQAGTHTYAYDDLHRLTSVVYPGPATTSYAFDAFGNRTSKTDAGGTTAYAYDDADRITSVTPPSPAPVVSYTWDDNGNLTDRGADDFAWDYEDRMTSATVNSVTTTFAYRGDGLRDSRTTGGTTTTFTWDIAGGLPVILDDGSQYLYGAGLVSQTSGANTYYYLADGLGSTMKSVDSSGTVVNAYTYDIYGKKTSSSGSQANEFDFAGQQTDATGLQYLRARYYDPETGTFLSRDPMANAPGWSENSLVYAAGSPSNRVDPRGLWSIIPPSILGGCVMGVGAGCKGGGPPGIDGECDAWSAYTMSDKCRKQVDRLDDWIQDQLADIAPLIGEYVTAAPSQGGPKKLTGFTKHGVTQAVLNDGHGVSTRAIRDAVKHGVVTKQVRDGKQQWIFKGKDATVILNDAGEVVTTWATSRRGWRY